MQNPKTGSLDRTQPPEESVRSFSTGHITPPEQDLPEKLGMIPGPIQSAENDSEDLKAVPRQKVAAVSAAINACMNFINRRVVGRREIVKQSFLALVTGEHQLLISRTGMAKSMLARQIFSCFNGAQLFEKQLTKDTMPENLFGAYDIEAMKKGKMIHNVEGSLVLSHFAFLDEIFDANDMLLRSLLSLLNEKQLVNGEQIVHSTLHSAIAAANYIRVTEVLEAVVDRFLYKGFIPENRALYFQYSVDQIYQEHFGRVSPPEKRITLGELSFIKKLIQSRQIHIPGYVLFLKNYIIKKYIAEIQDTDSSRQNFTVSDRTSVKMQDTLRACAVLDGRLQVEEKDLDELYFAVCVLGREEEQARLAKITAAARNYFRQDRNTLENVFNAIGIFNIIRAGNGDETLKSDRTFSRIRDRLAEISRAESSVFREYFNRFKKTIMTLTRDTCLSDTIRVLEDIGKISLQAARSREAREIIAGFQEDIFNEKKYFSILNSHQPVHAAN